MSVPPGTRLGSYLVKSLIGSGGMGEVYLAHDDRLRRDVALKLMAPRLEQEAQAVDRFIREALAVSALNHPNIVTIHETGEAAAGRCARSSARAPPSTRRATSRGRWPRPWPSRMHGRSSIATSSPTT